MQHTIHGVTFSVRYEDIVQVPDDVIVVPTTPALSMTAGIARKVRDNGAADAEKHALKHAPAQLGDIVVTSAGQLCSRFIFHCVMINEHNNGEPDALRTGVKKMIAKAQELGVTTCAIPALGASFPPLTPKTSTQIIVEETIAAAAAGTAVCGFDYVVCDPTPYAFYKRSLQRAIKKIARS